MRCAIIQRSQLLDGHGIVPQGMELGCIAVQLLALSDCGSSSLLRHPSVAAAASSLLLGELDCDIFRADLAGECAGGAADIGCGCPKGFNCLGHMHAKLSECVQCRQVKGEVEGHPVVGLGLQQTFEHGHEALV